MKKIINSSLLMALLFTNIIVKAQTTSSTPPKDGAWYKIQVVQTGKYLAVENGSKENGARIVLWDNANGSNHKFLAKKNADGTYSFFAGHSGKSICADKGDEREGDLIIQNSLAEYFGKWYLSNTMEIGCHTTGFRVLYKSSGGKPMQVFGSQNGTPLKLIEAKYYDGAHECATTFYFIETTSPLMDIPAEKSQKKPAGGVIIKKPAGN